MSRLPFRWRLTLWYGGLLGVTLLLVGVLLYAGLRWRLSDTFDDQLHSQAELTMSTLVVTGDQISLEAGQAIPGEQEYFVRVVSQNGDVAAERGAVPVEVAASDVAISAALNGESRLDNLDAGDDVQLRVLTVPIRETADGAVIGALQVGLDRTDLDETLSQVLLALLILIPLALAAAVGGGYVLAGRLLRPLAQVTALAGEMGEHAFHERLNLDLPDDELGHLARTFDEMLDRIEDAFERQRRFTADAAHELRTPLSLIRSQVDLALSRPRSAEAYREALQGVDADLARLTGLAAALLTIARLERPEPDLDRAAFDIAATIAAVVASYEPAFRQAGVSLDAATTPATLLADEDAVIQVLVNLVDNAFAHTPRGGSVEVGNTMTNGIVTVWVADSGAGIPVADQDRVFDRFYRPDAGRARAHGGAGIGLAICRAIVEAHGGTISLESEVGKGTRVTFRLPVGER